jgi:hypothetical protein
VRLRLRGLALTPALGLALIASVVAAASEPDWASMPYTRHADFQAVDADGFATFNVFAGPVKMRGVILNRAADLLPTAPDATPFMGGSWQVYVQTVDPGDFGGTACWMGQNIGKIVGNHPAGSYTAAEWLLELDRLDHDPATGHAFEPGDVVEIRARAPGLPFRGKTNVNEQHSNDPTLDFDVVLLQAGDGLPVPPVLPLSALKDAGDAFIFDPTRATGCERYQGTLVRFNGVSFVDTTGWGPDAELVVTDGVLTFPVKLGLGAGFSVHPPPAGPVDLIGILDQEDLVDTDGYKDGYRLWVVDDWGGGCILPEPFPLVGDTNCDGWVDFADIPTFIVALSGEANYAQQVPCCLWLNGDVDGVGGVSFVDIPLFIALLGG